MKKIAIYARVSTDKQTCENQLIELRAVAERMGYAFQRIQRWALECKQSLQTNGLPVGHQPDSFVIRQMDAIFLNVLRNRPELGPELFMRLFSKVSSEKLIRFLSDQGRVSDYLAVILALPSGVFIKSAYQLAMKP